MLLTQIRIDCRLNKSKTESSPFENRYQLQSVPIAYFVDMKKTKTSFKMTAVFSRLFLTIMIYNPVEQNTDAFYAFKFTALKFQEIILHVYQQDTKKYFL